MLNRPLHRILCLMLSCAPLYLSACAGYESDGTVVDDQNATPTPEPVDGSTTVTTPGGTTTDTNATGEFALNVKGTTPMGMSGKTVNAALLDANGTVIGNTNTTAGASNFTLHFSGKLDRGMDYSVAYYIDRNGNGFCNIADPNDPNADVGYVLNANSINGNTTVSTDANAKGTTFVCSYFGTYDFAITGADFGAHNSEYVFVALMDKADGTFVAGPVNEVVLNSTWRFAFAGVMLAGHTYQARYFVDLNRNDTCQNHSWVYNMPAPASGNTAASVSHDQSQTQVCGDFPVTLPAD